MTLRSATNGSQKHLARLPMSSRKAPDISANIKVLLHTYIQIARLPRAEAKVEDLGDEIGNRVDRSLKWQPSFADWSVTSQPPVQPASFASVCSTCAFASRLPIQRLPAFLARPLILVSPPPSPVIPSIVAFDVCVHAIKFQVEPG